MYNVLKYRKTWEENDDISIYRYCTGTGNKFNVIICMTVVAAMQADNYLKWNNLASYCS